MNHHFSEPQGCMLWHESMILMTKSCALLHIISCFSWFHFFPSMSYPPLFFQAHHHVGLLGLQSQHYVALEFGSYNGVMLSLWDSNVLFMHVSTEFLETQQASVICIVIMKRSCCVSPFVQGCRNLCSTQMVGVLEQKNLMFQPFLGFISMEKTGISGIYLFLDSFWKWEVQQIFRSP